MRWIAVAAATWAGFVLASDLCLGAGIGQFDHGVNGSAALLMATRLNPMSMNARLAQMESLFQSWRASHDIRDLEEADMLARALARSFPGSAQARAAEATTSGMVAAHGEMLWVADATEAIAADPISVAMIEQQMFNLAVSRRDRAQFLRLGIKRASLTREPLKMKCPLCGKGWLEHGIKTR